jgi:hypothetical protein
MFQIASFTHILWVGGLTKENVLYEYILYIPLKNVKCKNNILKRFCKIFSKKIEKKNFNIIFSPRNIYFVHCKLWSKYAPGRLLLFSVMCFICFYLCYSYQFHMWNFYSSLILCILVSVYIWEFMQSEKFILYKQILKF